MITTLYSVITIVNLEFLMKVKKLMKMLQRQRLLSILMQFRIY